MNFSIPHENHMARLLIDDGGGGGGEGGGGGAGAVGVAGGE